MNLDHLSYSSIATYLQCPAAWRFKYIEKIATPLATELIFGSAFHQAVENSIALGGNPLEHWSNAWAAKSTEQEIDWDGDTPESLFNQGIAMLSADDVIKTIKSIRTRYDSDGKPAIETKVELRVEGVPIPVIGFVDLLHEDGSVCDFKTSSRQWSEDKALTEMQPIFYFAALEQMGIWHTWNFRHYVFIKNKVPRVQIINSKRAPDELGFLYRMIRSVWHAIDAGVFPENPTTWKHDPRYCDYWGVCVNDLHNQNRKQLAGIQQSV